MGAVSVFMTGNYLRQPVGDDDPLFLSGVVATLNKYTKTTIITTAFWILFTVQYTINKYIYLYINNKILRKSLIC